MRQSSPLSFPDLLALVFAVVIVATFVIAPWQGNAAIDPTFIAFAAGIGGLLAALWGIGAPDDRNTARIGQLIAGVVGVVYFVIYVVFDNPAFRAAVDIVGPWFLLILGGFIGLVITGALPRPPFYGEAPERITRPRAFLFRLAVLALIDALAIQMAVVLGANVSPLLGIGIAIFTLIINIVFLDDRLFPWRWISPAIAGMALLILYPMGYSIVISLTNYGDGHLLSKEQVVSQLEKQYFAPEGAPVGDAYLFARPGAEGQTAALRMFIRDSDGREYIGIPDDPNGLRDIAEFTLGDRDEDGIPTSIDDFQRVPRNQFAPTAQKLQGVAILDAENAPFRVTGIRLLQGRLEVRQSIPKYTYDPVTDTLKDNETGNVYRNERGTFTTGEGENRRILQPGFGVYIGFENYTRVVTDPNVNGPFWRVFAWTVVFALGSVLFTFALGMFLAILLNARDLPLRPLWRSLLIIPYAVPFWLSAVTWRGMFSDGGPINDIIRALTGQTTFNPFADPALAKIIVLFVNLYLGFPYMMLITLGALQAIPADMYEAALIDGANDRQQFQFITLPMILIAVGPLLVASFAFNFNNFTLIELLTSGRPPMGAGTPAGHTDILISYTYRLAFSGARGVDYGFASAVGMFIFLIVGTITFINFRFTRALEEAAQ
ncbi:MAG: ABC transporter permease subunit [Anaerolineae bacterium]|nr:ABC transporter permease subunit [Anaerolineae bacterium]